MSPVNSSGWRDLLPVSQINSLLKQYLLRYVLFLRKMLLVMEGLIRGAAGK